MAVPSVPWSQNHRNGTIEDTIETEKNRSTGETKGLMGSVIWYHSEKVNGDKVDFSRTAPISLVYWIEKHIHRFIRILIQTLRKRNYQIPTRLILLWKKNDTCEKRKY